MRLGMINLNSLTNKIASLGQWIVMEELKVVAVSETWLVPEVLSSFVDLPDFQIVRGDTDSDSRKHGVALYVSNEVKYLTMEVDLPNVAAVCLSEYNVYVVAVYRPPSYDVVQNNALVSFLADFCYGREIILLGD